MSDETKNRRNPRSSAYQFLLNEISVAPDLLDSFSSQDNLYKRLSPFEYSETILDLEEQLRKEFWRIIEENLNEKQQKLVKLIAQGLTQQEVAKILGINQSSASKNLTGSKEVLPDGTVKMYGGISRKLRAAMEKDQAIKDLLAKISDLRDDTWIKE
jgi:DNA-binding CsgD family transcriptional regulator